MLTFNGNENILQNDMGNAQVMDAKTGNMIGLNDGFVPVGIKEHGGVLYIASYNHKTKEGELGTIPSPRIQATLDKEQKSYNNVVLSDLNDSITHIVDSKVLQTYVPLCNVDNDPPVFRVGDQFLIKLNFEGLIECNEKDLLSTYDEPKLYKITLHSKTITGNYVDITSIIPGNQAYYNTQGESVSSPYWFLLDTDDVDIEKTYKHPGLLLVYPNIPPGYLHIKIEVEKPFGVKPLFNNTNFTYSCLHTIVLENRN